MPRRTWPTRPRTPCATAPRPSSTICARSRRRSIFEAGRLAHVRPELFDYAEIDPPLERHDERGQLFQLRPTPRIELLIVPTARTDIDLAVGALEPEGKPHLLLAAITASPGGADELIREVVGQPVACPRDEARANHARFLGKLAPCCLLEVFAFVDAALRHLPPGAGAFGLALVVGPAPDENTAFAVEQHDPDARPVRQKFLVDHGAAISLALVT